MERSPVRAEAVPEPRRRSVYPKPFASRVAGRVKRKLGDHFGLTNFGVNLTRLAPGAISALMHHHSEQDEFVYVLDGTPTLLLGEDAFDMQPGDCVGFRAGAGESHQLVNRSDADVVFLEIGDRSGGDEVEYPHDDLALRIADGGAFVFSRKDGTPYEG